MHSWAIPLKLVYICTLSSKIDGSSHLCFGTLYHINLYSLPLPSRNQMPSA